jgi:hypothetical protein
MFPFIQQQVIVSLFTFLAHVVWSNFHKKMATFCANTEKQFSQQVAI